MKWISDIRLPSIASSFFGPPMSQGAWWPVSWSLTRAPQ